MPVTLRSPVLGQNVGYVYTGPLEAWLVSEGYGVRDAALPYADTFTVNPANDNKTDYTGDVTADGFNTLDAGGKADGVLPVSDPTVAANREAPKWPSASEAVNIANSPDNLNDTKFPHTPTYTVDGNADGDTLD